jgi:hypothetical protein
VLDILTKEFTMLADRSNLTTSQSSDKIMEIKTKVKNNFSEKEHLR